MARYTPSTRTPFWEPPTSNATCVPSAAPGTLALTVWNENLLSVPVEWDRVIAVTSAATGTAGVTTVKATSATRAGTRRAAPILRVVGIEPPQAAVARRRRHCTWSRRHVQGCRSSCAVC